MEEGPPRGKCGNRGTPPEYIVQLCTDGFTTNVILDVCINKNKSVNFLCSVTYQLPHICALALYSLTFAVSCAVI